MRDVARTDDELALFRDAAGKSLALVPLVARGRSVGVLTVGWQKPGWRPTRDEWSLIEALAQRIALAVDGALHTRSARTSRGRCSRACSRSNT